MNKEPISVDPEAIAVYNDWAQSEKPEEERQDSYKKLGIEDWEITEVTGEEILQYHIFVETSGAVPSAYYLWKLWGHNSKLGDLISQVQKGIELPKDVEIWNGDVLDPNYDLSEIERKIKNGEIYPPLIFLPRLNGENIGDGLLNLGNILDGNRRMIEVARYLKTLPEEELENFRMTVFIGRVNPIKYIKFMTYYLSEPWINKVKKYLGKDAEKIEKEHVMRFFERWYLLLQRIGYKDRG